MQYFLQNRDARVGALLGAAGMMLLLVAACMGYYCGRTQSPGYSVLDLHKVSTAASGTNMAVATGAVSDDAEGVFFLDYLTGDLQCLVYYPRSGAFGARYYTNIQQQLPGSGKSAQYLMVTGSAITSRTSSNMKPANCLVYITDVNSGTFAAYTVPWSKQAESSSQAQLGTLVFVGGGPIRNYQVNDAAAKKPVAPVKDPAAKPAGVKPNVNQKPNAAPNAPVDAGDAPDDNAANNAANNIDPMPKGIKRKK